jgi:hypothetical protein
MPYASDGRGYCARVRGMAATGISVESGREGVASAKRRSRWLYLRSALW